MDWTIDPLNPIRFVAWDGESEALVYLVGSGDLHLVNEVGLRILKFLEQGPQSSKTILHLLQSSANTPAIAEALSPGLLEQTILPSLSQLGIIRKA